MKILMFPGRSASDNNDYINILVRAMRVAGTDISDWNKYIPLQNADIFHVHWPEILYVLRNRPRRQIEGDFFIWNFFDTIDRIKSRGGKIFWTVHNIKPHSAAISADASWHEFIDRFISQVDAYFVLTEAGLPEIWQHYPALQSKPHFVTPHPHYRDVVGDVGYDASYKKDVLGNRGVKLLACLGNLRPNKNIDLAAKAVAGLPKDAYHLLISGEAHEPYKSQLQAIVASAENITASYSRLSPAELIATYSQSDAALFPANDYFNSGTIFTALSLNVPVIAAATPTNIDIQKKVGDDWLFLYGGELSSSAIIEGFKVLVERRASLKCDLSHYSPSLCAASTISGYKSIM